ncbi:hypothetical protein LCGC14_1644670 [marine sediment metagenome]|uniref:Lipoprotein n=2 Tax=root TaxID=1 RepID=A0A831QPS6_9FLAO|nr:hypothetical protein [Pricia antarctica]
MKTILTQNRLQTRHVIVLCSFLILFWSCATSELADSWKSKDFDTLSNANILVVTEKLKVDVRKSYEMAIANKLRGRKLNAIESHIQFPSLKRAKTPSEKADRTQRCKDAGILGIMVISLKEAIETQNGALSEPIGFLEGYEDKKSSVLNSTDMKESFATTSKTYVLEAQIFNLALEEGKQLVSVFMVDITDPSSFEILRKTFTKIVVNQFK